MRRIQQGVIHSYVGKGSFFSRLMHATEGTSCIEAPLFRFMALCGRSPEARRLDQMHREQTEDFASFMDNCPGVWVTGDPNVSCPLDSSLATWITV
jgi:hypothetical protein